MKFLKILISRIFITFFLLGIQIGWFVYAILALTKYSVYLSLVLNLISIGMVLYLINKEENASYKISWIILILMLPIFGGLFYLFFGDKRPSKKLRNKLNLTHQMYRNDYIQKLHIIKELKQMDKRDAQISQYILKQSDFPIYDKTLTTYYPVGEVMFQDMLEELERAEHFIFLEYFIIDEGYMWNTILDILVKKAKQGVDVRLIYDDVGSIFLLPKGYDKKMEALGIRCLPFNPFLPFFSLVLNNRDHRKILVIDGHTAFNGGINLADEYINQKKRFGHWKDTAVKLKGEGVWSFTLMFLEIWAAFKPVDVDITKFSPYAYKKERFESDGYVQPFGDSPLDNEKLGENIYTEIINAAKDYVYIFTPYLILDDEMKSSFCLAAKRGVDIRIVTPAIPDKKMVYRLTRSNYAALLKAGVKIYEYTPGFLHAKSFVSDDRVAVVGTINLDYRSLYLHFECGTFMYHCKAVMDLKKDALKTMKLSKEIKEYQIKSGLTGRIAEAFLRFVSPLV